MQVSAKDLQHAFQLQQVVPPNPPSAIQPWTSIHFNVSGNRILVESMDGLAIVLDGFEGTIQRVFQVPDSTKCISRFTPDDQSLVMGTEKGSIYCWNIQSGTMVQKLEGHLGPIGALACNPKYAQMASSCTNTCLWIW